jgi:multidrug resistance protein
MRGAVASVGAALFVDSLLYSVVVPVLPGYATGLGASPTAISLLFASYAAALLAATPLAAAAADRWGRCRPLLAGAVGVALATLLFALATSYPVLLAARAAQGAAAAAVWTAGVALVAEVVPAEGVGQALGAVLAGMSAGLIAGPPIGGVLADAFGHRAPFLACAAVAAAVCLVLVRLVRQESVRQPDPAAAAGRPAGPASTGPGSAGPDPTGPDPTGPDPTRPDPTRPDPTGPGSVDRPGTGAARAGFRELLRAPAVRAALAAAALGAAALSTVEPLLPVDLHDRLGAGSLAIGLLFGAATLAHGAVSPLVGRFADRCPRSRLIPAGLLGMAVLAPLLTVPRHAGAVGALLVGYAIAYSFVLVPVLARLAGAVRGTSGGYATGYGLFNITYAVGMFAGPLAGGAVAAALSVPGALAALAVPLLVGAALLARQHPSPLPTPEMSI